MSKFRFYFSLIIAKLSYYFLKITKLSSGTAIIGWLVLKICPDFLVYVNSNIRISKINITGTNGKTTTSGLLTHLLKKEKKKVINNTSGANMLTGIVNTFSTSICPLFPAEYSVIETDEAFLEKVYDKLNGDYLLVTNLFEDQTDRFESPLFTKSLIQKAIDKQEDVQLVLNADEPISAGLISKNKTPIYFSIKKVFDENKNEINHSKTIFSCPVCKKDLNYSKNYYSQIGHYNCDCGYKQPDAKYKAEVILYKTYSILTLDNDTYEVPLAGLFNAYNALGAIVLAKELGIKNIQENIKTFKVAFGRNEKRILNGHDTIIQLIKNPAGTNEVIKSVDINSDILIAINNNEADGTDTSWINQVEFELLAKTKKEVVVTGLCAETMSERLKKAGVQRVKIIADIDRAIEHIGNAAEENITVLTTYTALLKIDKIKEMKKCF